MRSIDRYRERYKKSSQSGDKQEAIEWDFKTSPSKPNPPKLPIFLSESNTKDKIKEFERFIRQLGRAIYSCSLCARGTSLLLKNNTLRDPHYPPSIWHKEIAIFKWQPDGDDFGELIPVENRNDFYISSIVKCPGNCDYKCPFIDLEIDSLSQCWFKLIIILDKKTADYFGINWKIGQIQGKESKTYCCEYGSKEFTTIVKGLSNPQIRKRLLTS